MKAWTQEETVNVGHKNPDYGFQIQANTDTRPTSSKPESLVPSEWMSARFRQTNEAWWQALGKCTAMSPGTERGQ